jgi:hypothetical protein
MRQFKTSKRDLANDMVAETELEACRSNTCQWNIESTSGYSEEHIHAGGHFIISS